ncbi:MAG TPA: phage holin family protein [Acidimicrobiales bacterium]|nr:phage holin family protein [Acidimicrobiales bacterium]
MVRFLLRVLLTLVGNAVGLIVAAWILDDMALDASGFFIALVIFTVLMIVLQPLMVKVAMQYVRPLAGATALATTFVSLLVTELISDGLEIEGFVTWVLATLIVWLVSMLAAIILPAIFLKEAVQGERGAKGPQTFTP